MNIFLNDVSCFRSLSIWNGLMRNKRKQLKMGNTIGVKPRSAMSDNIISRMQIHTSTILICIVVLLIKPWRCSRSSLIQARFCLQLICARQMSAMTSKRFASTTFSYWSFNPVMNIFNSKLTTKIWPWPLDLKSLWCVVQKGKHRVDLYWPI